MRLVALVATITVIVAALVGVGSAQAPEATAPAEDKSFRAAFYWQQKGCDHSHRSKVAYKRTSRILKNQTPFTRAEGKRVRHYVACVATRDKSLAVNRHVKRLREWRSSNVCTTTRGNRELGRCMAARDKGWTGVQFSCLDELWGGRESGWDVYAHNPYSGAHGIPQALPGWKMGPGWWDNPFVQIDWGLDYIDGRFGTPCGAVAFHDANGWY